MREDDEYGWLEEVNGSAALAWVAEQNAVARETFEGDARFQGFFGSILSKLTDHDRFAAGRHFDGFIYNFWQDRQHRRGIWRRIELDRYLDDRGCWETLLDIDELNALEGANWVFRGASFLAPGETKALISLSDGGRDAVAMREFDLLERAFVLDGFQTDRAKQSGTWLDRDRLIVASSADPLGASKAGYGIAVRMLQRGTALAEAPVIYRGDPDDMAVQVNGTISAGERIVFITQRKNFFESAVLRVEEDGRLLQLPVPGSAKLAGVCRQLALLRVKEQWDLGGERLEPGSIVSLDLDALRRSSTPRVRPIFTPGPRSSVTNVAPRRDDVVLVVSEDVKSRLFRARLQGDCWITEPLELPDFGAATIESVDGHSNVALMSFASFLEPETLYLLDEDCEMRPVRTAPREFDPTPYAVTQRFASSADGTAIPYFLIRPAASPTGARLPMLLFGYGGFERSIRPHYLAPMVQEWLAAGGAYAIANIRGGGEYGPRWHRAALREKRVVAFEDFIAVAEDLIDTGITSPSLLGIKGGSNGGLLMGAMLTRRPELFGAIICRVPLLDMLRFHKMQAGASWTAEYGDPDDERDRGHLERISPYHNLAPGRDYPKVFFTTATGDDRVHPGHARKMQARMQQLGYDSLFFENMQGGHQTATVPEQMAMNAAMELVFLHQQLVDQAHADLSQRDALGKMDGERRHQP